MSRRSLVGIEMAIVVAEKQDCDVLSATGCKALPEWGRLAATWVLLKQPPRGGERSYRVTQHVDTRDEFGDGYYFGTLEDAHKAYIERVKRTWQDEAIYDQTMAAR